MKNLQIDTDLQEMFDSFLAEYSERGAGESGTLDKELWSQLEELGLLRLTGSEDKAGSGATWAEAQALITSLAKHGVRAPYAEHDLLAGWLVDELGLESGSVMTVGEIEGSEARRVPWASAADRIILIWRSGEEYLAQSFAPAELEIVNGSNNIGEPRDTVRVNDSAINGVSVAEEIVKQLRLKQAMVRAIQVSAALERALEVTIDHVTARNQFGRPLAKFQAVQHLVSDIAGESALAQAAKDTALLEAINSDWSGENLEFLVAVARSNVGHSASVVVRNAHQAHGAIGTTIEHELHKSTRAALAWRGEYGSVASWDALVMDRSRAAGSDGLWNLIAS
ncbi:MAG TPA: acyl-CoA dehydrogenase family protein [Microbacteriaceae bacterium]|nr:acyl-CoA dehydrogenase family protein [Microbacteriaceae bacterium]